MAEWIPYETMGANQDIVQGRLFAEEVDVLKGSGHSDRNHLMWLLISDRAIAIVKLTLIGILKPTQNIEESSFSRAVRSNQAKYFSALDLQAYVVAGGKPAKSDGDVTTAQVAGHRRPLPLSVSGNRGAYRRFRCLSRLRQLAPT